MTKEEQRELAALVKKKDRTDEENERLEVLLALAAEEEEEPEPDPGEPDPDPGEPNDDEEEQEEMPKWAKQLIQEMKTSGKPKAEKVEVPKVPEHVQEPEPPEPEPEVKKKENKLKKALRKIW